MSGLPLIHDSKRGPWRPIEVVTHIYDDPIWGIHAPQNQDDLCDQNIDWRFPRISVVLIAPVIMLWQKFN